VETIDTLIIGAGPAGLTTAYRLAGKIKASGGRIAMDRRFEKLSFDQERRTWTVETIGGDGTMETFQARHVVSSAPIPELLSALSPKPLTLFHARALKYRDFLTVILIGQSQRQWPDNWIYIHDPRVKVGRVQNFRSWSPEMVPDATSTCLGLEYFCSEGDALWSMEDSRLIALAKQEIAAIGLLRGEVVTDACVVRQKKAYPVYDETYFENLRMFRFELASRFPALHLVGRNGTHKYNNQDHAMMTGMLTAANILAGRTLYDVWQVNEDAEFAKRAFPARGRLLRARVLCQKEWHEAMAVQRLLARRGASEGGRASSVRLNSLWAMVKASWSPIPLIAFLVFVLSRSRRGIVQDTYIYLGRALADLDPNGVGRDLMFVHDGQFGFSLFRFITKAMVELFGLGAGAEILAILAALAWFFAAAFLARQFASGAAVWTLVVFTALLPAAYGAPHLLSFAERFAIPRPFDEALVLAGLAALAAGRDAVCLGCLLAAAFLHPIMAPAGFGVFVAVLGLEDKRWFWFCTFAGALLVLAGALGLPLTDRLFTAIDPSLKSLHESRSRFCFQAFGQPKVFRRSSFRQRPSPLPRISSKGAAGGSLRPP
jgi:hypothetical protein